MRRFFLIAIIAILFTGCVPSLHPFYTDLDLVSDPNLEGLWVNEDGNESWNFALTDDSLSYALVYTADENSKRFEARLLELDGIRYLDTYPDEDIENDLYKIHLVPAHIIAKIEILPDTLIISILDIDWLRDMITKGEIQIAHEDIDNGLVLTAQTGDLQRLLKAYANEPKAFSDQTVLYRR